MFLFFVFFTFAIFSAKLAKLCAGTLLFQLAEVIDKNNAVKVIDFMLNTNGEKPRSFKFEWFTFNVLCVNTDLPGPLHMLIESFK